MIDVGDRLDSPRQRDEAIDAQGIPPSWWHPFLERRQEPLVERIDWLATSPSPGLLPPQALTLFDEARRLAEAGEAARRLQDEKAELRLPESHR